jgi:hypothetical protein
MRAWRNGRRAIQALGLALAGQAAAHAAIYEVAVGQYNVTHASLRMYIPASLPVVRGIYIWGNGGVGDSRSHATDPEMVALADMLGFAVVGTSGIALTYTNPVGDVAGIEAAFASIANASGHPEIVRAPLLPIGHSNGGVLSYDLNAALPERVLATELSKAGNGEPLPSPAALRTPGILIAGEIDTPERIAAIRARFFDNRPRGALWAWAEEEGTDHTQVNGPEIAFPFAEMVARMRYPAGVSPVNGPVPLLALNEADGWLTDPDSYKTGLADIAPYASYAKDKSIAGWLPNKRAAYIFRAFASYHKATSVATIVPSNHQADPGSTITYTIGAPTESWNSIEYYEGDVLLKKVVPGDGNALSVQFSTTHLGYVVLHALVTFADGRQRTTIPRRVLVRVPPAAPPDTTQGASIITWGAAGPVALPPIGIGGVKMLAAGIGHVLALKTDGTVVGWGGNFHGESSVPAGLTDVVSIAAGGGASGAVKRDGTVVVWGMGAYLQQVVPAGLNNVRQLAIGEFDVLALRNDGTVVRWGNGTASNPPPSGDLGLKEIAAVASGNGMEIALKTDGTVVTIGSSSGFPIPPDLANVVAIAAASSHALALKADGTVVAWGSNTRGESDVPPGLTGVVAVSASRTCSLALQADGTVVAWGDPTNGVTSPPSSLPPAKAIAATDFNSVALIGVQPTFTSQPEGQFARPGDYVELSAGAAGSGDFTYQWSRNGVLIPGATSDTLTFSSVQPADAGSYTVTLSDGPNHVASAPVPVAVTLPNSDARLANISARAQVGTGDNVLIVGFVMSGPRTKNVLLRAVGPGLASSGLPGLLPRPLLTLYDETRKPVYQNGGWGGDAALATAFQQLNAFALDPNDAALLVPLAPGATTAQIGGVDSTTGLALAEIYDPELASAGGRLGNLSARARVGTGADILIAGFIVSGTQPITVLIRAIGPGLTAAAGISGVLSRPQLTLFDANRQPIYTNSGWGGNGTLAALFPQVGAFPLAIDSDDAALVVTLPPGVYTAQVAGVDGSSGIALVELYQVP